MSDDQQDATATDSSRASSDAGAPNVGDRSAGGDDNAQGGSGSGTSATHAGTTPAQGADLSGGGTSDTE